MIMYLYSVLPSKSCRPTIVSQADQSQQDLVAQFTSLPSHQLKDPFPLALRTATLELASNNLICSVALTGVLALQAGRFWAESADDEDMEEIETEDQKGTRSRAKTPEALQTIKVLT